MTVHIITSGSSGLILELTSSLRESATPPESYWQSEVSFKVNQYLRGFKKQHPDDFIEQQNCLVAAAKEAFHSFDLTRLEGQNFRTALELTPVFGNGSAEKAVSFTGESSGLSYSLAVTLCWVQGKFFNSNELIPTVPIFATGVVPSQGNGYVQRITGLSAKINHVCRYIEQKQSQSDTTISTSSHPAFYFFYPTNNGLIDSNAKEDEGVLWKKLTSSVEALGGKLIAISHISEVLTALLGSAFDDIKGLPAHTSFLGMKPIEYSSRRYFKGRDRLLDDLKNAICKAHQEKQILLVHGPSGAGKSSIVLGGVSQELVKGGFEPPYRVTPASFSKVEDLLQALLYRISDDTAQIMLRYNFK